MLNSAHKIDVMTNEFHDLQLPNTVLGYTVLSQ